jgi:hypothetical protein
MVVSEPTHNNYLSGKIRERIYKKSHLFDEETERDFTTKQLNTLFLSKGLKLKEQIYPGLLAYVLWSNPDAFPGLNKFSLSFEKMLLSFEKPFWRSNVARFLTFATMSIYTM